MDVTETSLSVGIGVRVVSVSAITGFQTAAYLQAVLDEQGSRETIMDLSGQWTIDANLTIPQNIHIRVARDGSFKVSANITFRIRGSIEAGNWQIFDDIDGTMILSTRARSVNAMWFGAKNDGTEPTATTTAINNALEALSDGGVLEFPVGNFLVEDSGTTYSDSQSNPFQACLVIPASNITVRGAGHDSRIYVTQTPGVAADATVPVIFYLTKGINYVTIERLRIEGHKTATAAIDNRRWGQGVYLWQNDHCTMRDLFIRDCYSGIKGNACDHIEVSGCTITGVGFEDSITASLLSNYWRIENNLIAPEGGETNNMGIRIVGDSRFNVVDGNLVRNMALEALLIEGSDGGRGPSDNIFSNNVATDSKWGMILRTGSRNKFIGNIVRNCENSGIQIGNQSYMTVGNVNYQSACRENEFIENTIIDCGWPAGHSPVMVGTSSGTFDDNGVFDTVLRGNQIILKDDTLASFPSYMVEIGSLRTLFEGNTIIVDQKSGLITTSGALRLNSAKSYYDASNSIVRYNTIRFMNVVAATPPKAIYIWGIVHEGVVVDGNLIYADPVVASSDGIDVQNALDVRVGNNHINGFARGIWRRTQHATLVDNSVGDDVTTPVLSNQPWSKPQSGLGINTLDGTLAINGAQYYTGAANTTGVVLTAHRFAHFFDNAAGTGTRSIRIHRSDTNVAGRLLLVKKTDKTSRSLYLTCQEYNTTAGHDASILTWAAGQRFYAGDTATNAANVYLARNSGVAGSTAPTHTAGAVTDGTIVWEFVFVYSDLVPRINGSLAAIELAEEGDAVLLQSNGAGWDVLLKSTKAVKPHGVVRAVYNFGSHGGATGTIGLGAILPSNAFVHKVLYILTTAFGSTTAPNVSFGWTGNTANLIADVAYNAAVYGVNDMRSGAPVFYAADPSGQQNTGAGTPREIAITISGGALNAGKLTMWVEYFAYS